LSSSNAVYKNLHIDLTNDGTTNRSTAPLWVNSGKKLEINGLTFTNPGYRTGVIFYHGFTYGSEAYISGCDFSEFPSSCEIVDGVSGGTWNFSNCLTASTWTPNTSIGQNGLFTFVNCGPENAPTYLYAASDLGALASTTAIYRTGGAEIEDTAVSYLVTTTALCTEGSPFVTPWIYDVVSTTGSKTFDLYVVNDTADLTDADIWLEVEFLGTTGEAISDLTSNHRTITTTAAAHTDDTTSTWNGTGPSFTYKQKLSVTATVNVAGQFRARVCVGKTSVISSAYLYLDPVITVT
jgi:hypothetical protein